MGIRYFVLHNNAELIQTVIMLINLMMPALQVKYFSEQIQKLVEDKYQSSAALENTQKRLLEVRRSSQQFRESLEELQSKVNKSRAIVTELQIELERER